MNKLLITIVIALAVLGGGFAVFSNSNKPGSPADTPIDNTSNFEKAPDFSLEDYNGNTVSLSDFEGRPLVINSWAFWCPFCKEELDDFAKIQKEVGDKVDIIAINRAESLKVAKDFTDEIGVTDDLIFLLDPNDSFYKSIGGFSMPETIFVDKNGNILEHKRGPMDVEGIREKVEKLLEF